MKKLKAKLFEEKNFYEQKLIKNKESIQQNEAAIYENKEFSSISMEKFNSLIDFEFDSIKDL